MCHIKEKPAKRTQGMNFVRKDLRLAIYLRDGMGCIYCGSGLEDGSTLTLDHVVPYSHGGSNSARNLVTACRQCNSSRGNRSISDFCEGVASYINHGVQGADILSSITNHLNTDIKPYRKQAKEIIANRPSWQSALDAAK